jgi:hypothetical protein
MPVTSWMGAWRGSSSASQREIKTDALFSVRAREMTTTFLHRDVLCLHQTGLMGVVPLHFLNRSEWVPIRSKTKRAPSTR